MAKVEKLMKERETLLRPVRRFRSQMIFQTILDHWMASWSLVGALLLLWLWIDKLFFLILPNPFLIAWVLGLITSGVLFLDWYRRPNLFQAAAALDSSAGTRERISSAIELLNDRKTPPDHRWQPSESALWKDALKWTEKLEKKHWYRWRPPKYWKAFVLILVALGLSAFAPQWDLLKRKEQQEKQQVESKIIQQKIARVEHLIERTRQKADEQDLKPVGDLVREIENNLQDLRQRPPSRREALKKLSQLENQTEQERQKLEPAKQALDQLGKNPHTKKLAEQLKQGNLKAALEEAQKLKEEIGKGELSFEKRLQLSKDLKAAMDTLNQQQGDSPGTKPGNSPNTSTQNAESQETENLQELSSLMDQLEGQMGPLGEQALSDEQMGEILDQLAQCKADMSGPLGNKPGKGAKLQRMGQSGQGSRLSGSGQQENQGEIPKIEEEGSTNLDQPGGPGRSWSDRALPAAEYVKLYDPRRTELEGVDLRSNSTIGEGPLLGTVEVEGKPTAEEPTIPYAETFESFRSSAEDALSQEQVPLKYRPVVRQYFDSVDSLTDNGSVEENRVEEDTQGTP